MGTSSNVYRDSKTGEITSIIMELSREEMDFIVKCICMAAKNGMHDLLLEYNDYKIGKIVHGLLEKFHM